MLAVPFQGKYGGPAKVQHTGVRVKKQTPINFPIVVRQHRNWNCPAIVLALREQLNINASQPFQLFDGTAQEFRSRHMGRVWTSKYGQINRSNATFRAWLADSGGIH